MKLWYRIPLILLAIGVVLYLLGWLVMGDYSLVLLGFGISIFSLGWVSAVLAEVIKKRPIYWLGRLSVAGLILLFLGVLLFSYVPELGNVPLWLGLGVLYLVFMTVMIVLQARTH